MSLIQTMSLCKCCRNYTQTTIGSKLTPQLLKFLSAGFHTTKISA